MPTVASSAVRSGSAPATHRPSPAGPPGRWPETVPEGRPAGPAPAAHSADRLATAAAGAPTAAHAAGGQYRLTVVEQRPSVAVDRGRPGLHQHQAVEQLRPTQHGHPAPPGRRTNDPTGAAPRRPCRAARPPRSSRRPGAAVRNRPRSEPSRLILAALIDGHGSQAGHGQRTQQRLEVLLPAGVAGHQQHGWAGRGSRCPRPPATRRPPASGLGSQRHEGDLTGTGRCRCRPATALHRPERPVRRPARRPARRAHSAAPAPHRPEQLHLVRRRPTATKESLISSRSAGGRRPPHRSVGVEGDQLSGQRTNSTGCWRRRWRHSDCRRLSHRRSSARRRAPGHPGHSTALAVPLSWL